LAGYRIRNFSFLAFMKDMSVCGLVNTAINFHARIQLPILTH
jgi:hypothetical protein